MKRAFCLTILAICLNYGLFSQGNLWKVYSQSTPISSICVDTNNVTWVATNTNGLSLYKNNQWIVLNMHTFQLPSNFIKHINKDKNGDIWLVFANALMKMQNYNAVYIEYDDFTSNADFDSSNNLWIGSKNGLRTFNGNTWTTYSQFSYSNSNSEITSVKIDKKNNVWIGANTLSSTKFCDLICYNPKNQTVLKNFNNLNSCMPLGSINNIEIEKSNNTKWISILFGGLVKITDSTCNLFNTSNSNLKHNDVFQVLEKNGMKYIAQYGGGISVYNDTAWLNYNSSNSGILNNVVRCLAFDNKETLWAGFSNNGICNFDKFNWKIFDRFNTPIPTNVIKSIAIDSFNTKWLGIHNRFTTFNDTTWSDYETPYSRSQGSYKTDYLNDIVVDKYNAKWVGTTLGGLCRFGKSNFTNQYDQSYNNLPSNNVTCIAIDKNNIKWIGTPKGLVKYNDTIFETFNYIQGLSYLDVTSLAIDTNRNVWIGCNPSNGFIMGLIKYDGVNFKQFNSANSPIEGYSSLDFIFIDKNNHLWTHNSKAILKYDGVNWEEFTFKEIGLIYPVIHKAKQDDNNDLWFATSQGLLKYDYKNWKLFNIINSDIPVNDVLDLNIDKKGKIWVGTNTGGIGVMQNCPIDTSILYLINTLEIKTNAEYYQWMTIENGKENIIPFENKKVFKPLINGKYFAIIRNGDCVASTSIFKINKCLIDTNLIISDTSIEVVQKGLRYQWINCTNGDTLKDDTLAFLAIKKNGNYAVIINNGECMIKSKCINVNTLSTTNLKQNKEIIFPNPTTGHISINSQTPIRKIVITNTLGKIIFEKEMSNENNLTLNIQDLPSGIYFLNLNSINYKIIKI